MVASRREARDFDEFDEFLRRKLDAVIIEANLKSNFVDEMASEKDTLMRLAVDDFKASIYYGYENICVEGTKDEFLEYLEFRKSNFVYEVESMDFLDSQDERDFLIAFMYLEIGIFEINLDNLEEFIALENDSVSSVDLKSVAACNWWCKAKKYAECALLTEGTVGGFALF